MNMDTSFTEIEIICKKEYTKLKPPGVLHAVGSVVSAFSTYCI